MCSIVIVNQFACILHIDPPGGLWKNLKGPNFIAKCIGHSTSSGSASAVHIGLDLLSPGIVHKGVHNHKHTICTTFDQSNVQLHPYGCVEKPNYYHQLMKEDPASCSCYRFPYHYPVFNIRQNVNFFFPKENQETEWQLGSA